MSPIFLLKIGFDKTGTALTTIKFDFDYLCIKLHWHCLSND